MATLTAGLATFAIFNGPVLGIGPLAFIDAGLFAIIAVGLWRMSRGAAVAGLVLFVAEKILGAIESGSFQGAHVAAVLILAFVHGVRGTFALARLTATPRPAHAAIEPK